MKSTSHIKGVRIQTVNMVMLALSLAMFIAVLFTTHHIADEYRATLKATENYMEWEKATRSMQAGSDYLTAQAQLYAATGDRAYADKYFHELYQNRSREKALETLKEHDLHSDHEDHNCDLKKALNLSNALAFREIYVIRLLAEANRDNLDDYPPIIRQTRLNAADRAASPREKTERARDLMANVTYQKAKEDIRETLGRFLNQTTANLREAQRAQTLELGKVLNRERIMLIALCLLNVLTFAMIIVLIVRPLKIYLKCIQNDSRLEAMGAYEFKHLALTYNDVFALKEHHDKMLRHKAEHDPLTGLYNRAAYDSISAMLKENKSPVGLLLLDVDKFKSINDTYGHIIGDKTLCNVANQLLRNFRADDYCIRLGGDEFAVIFSVQDPGIENIILEKIRTINYELKHPEEDVPATSLSVGGVISTTGFNDNMYKDADSALYKVKEAGRCGCQFYHPARESKPSEE